MDGAKLYAADFRAADLPGWPAETSHAILVRAPDATHVYTGMDLARLSGTLKPSTVVTAADLARIGTRVPEFYKGDLFCPVGRTPLYLGQPVALLIFEQFDSFDQVRPALRDGTFVKFGEETGPVVAPDYGAYRFTRMAGPTPDAPNVYSPVKDGWVSPGHFQSTERPVWTPLGAATASPYAKAASYGEQIRAELAASNPALLVLDRCFSSRNPASHGTIRVARRSSSWSARIAVRGSGVGRVPSGQSRRRLQAGAHQHPFCLCRRRLRRTRPYPVPHLRRIGRDVLSRPPGPAHP
jgi:hypothetical protein